MTDLGMTGIYIHVPFCKRKCLYCDFASCAGGKETDFRKYTDRIKRDIEKSVEKFGELKVDTVFFGGGTPSLLPTDLLAELLSVLGDSFELSDKPEITFECNPGTVDGDKLSALHACGFNRISIGVQSMNDNELKALGRIHDPRQAELCVMGAREAGFDNISVDLMYGIPGQTAESFEKSIRKVCSWGIDHLSAYCLQIEEGTPFFERKSELDLPDDDVTADMYRLLGDLAGEYSLARYEISNFAKTGRESRHNLKYWTRQPYLGFGPAAHSFFCNERFCNSSDVSAWLDGRDTSQKICNVTERDAEVEYVMLGMRLARGIEIAEYDRLFANLGDFESKYGEKLKKYIDAGLVQIKNDRVSFTENGFFVSNTVLSDLLDFE